MKKKICFILTIILVILLLIYAKEYLPNFYLTLFLLIINIFVAFFFPKYFLGTYTLFLCFVLLFRETQIQGDTNYFDNWLSIVFQNKTVFVNVFGNVALFIPLGFVLNDNAHYGILFIVIIELLQKIFSKGVFDYYDILLNSLGILIGLLVWEIYIWMTKRKKRKKLKRYSKA